MLPFVAIPRVADWRLPRIRGGVSPPSTSDSSTSQSSPHTRGCFFRTVQRRHTAEVFPAYAGVFLRLQRVRNRRRSLPRIRGGVSASLSTSGKIFPSSPHTRGCFHFDDKAAALTAVFPAYAGVFLSIVFMSSFSQGLPRIRGGVSSTLQQPCAFFGSSPHTRGCFSRSAPRSGAHEVFPAYAGVFPGII